MLENLKPADPFYEDVQEIKNASGRAASLTRQLLAFTHKQVIAPRLIDLNNIVSEMDRMLRRLIGSNIQLMAVMEPRLGCFRADPGQIEQIIVNLAVNARDAMPHGGNLTIETCNIEVDGSTVPELYSAKPGRYALLTVTDTGCGLDEETQARIFEPFFTTKPQGKGTGLGLATTYGAVRQIGGTISVTSQIDLGTTFRIYFPRADAAIEQQAPAAVPFSPKYGTETVLLVEDEDTVRTLAATVLRTAGYTVLEAHHGEEAVCLSQRYAGTIHLLLTDVIMPRMGGRLLKEQLTAQRPGVRTIFMSGYLEDAAIWHDILQSKTPFLQKPFTPNLLACKVREVLEGGSFGRMKTEG